MHSQTQHYKDLSKILSFNKMQVDYENNEPYCTDIGSFQYVYSSDYLKMSQNWIEKEML